MAAGTYSLGFISVERKGEVCDRETLLGRMDGSGNRSRIEHKSTDGQQNQKEGAEETEGDAERTAALVKIAQNRIK